MICVNTKRRHCDVQPEPRPVQLGTVLAAVQTAARRLRRWPTASLDRGCARRSAGRQDGTKGWVCPIEQRDASFDPGSASPPAMTNLLNFAHTTRPGSVWRRLALVPSWLLIGFVGADRLLRWQLAERTRAHPAGEHRGGED